MNVRRLLPPVLASALALLLTALMLTISAGAAQAKPAPERDYPRMPRVCASAKDKIPQKPVVCRLNQYNVTKPTIQLWGDSHAWMMIPALKKAAQKQKINLIATMMGGCPPMDNQVSEGEAAPGCYHGNRMALEFAEDTLARGNGLSIVIGASWQRYRKALKTRDQTYTGQMARAMTSGTPRLARTLAGLGAEVDVIGQVATVPEVRKTCKKDNSPYACNVPRKQALQDEKGTKAWVTKMFRPATPGQLINVNGYFCSSSTCRGFVKKTYTWWDDLHISASMSTLLNGYLAPTVTNLVGVDEPDKPNNPGGGGGDDCTLLILCR